MARRNGSLTLTESVFSELRTDILSGHLSPGSPLLPGELKIRFDVSIAVVREALTRLAAQGLAKQSPNYGFTVMTLSKSDLEDIIEARSINEGAALRQSISKGDVLWESNIIALHHQLEQTPEYSSNDKTRINDDWSLIHSNFHRSLIEACDNQILLDICDRLWNMSELYRNWSVPRDSNRPIANEHKALMQAALDRDINHAIDLFNAHIQLTIDILIDHDKSEHK
ncbi:MULTISPECIES: GntR family transcriptional regulator [unclassified Clostridium]|uniref:GntR family transcriptional regulator n=1 Tax=unclassified Clostridium TaxID=2614128 RepID=UPI0002981F3D|nr:MULTISPECIES: GntR family transcriptional regulator [unclassified Clostridium]EKQ57729.1 MAG: transcriptional regulator [Clostridium sp. Maddingley MBC34-26]